MRIQIKNIKDLENTLGKDLARWFIQYAKNEGGMKRVPSGVTLVNTKPPFYLDDGSTLRAFAVDLASSKVLGEQYIGSSDTAINHPEQFDKSYQAPENKAVVFLETYWNGRNTSWNLTVVSSNIQTILPKV